MKKAKLAGLDVYLFLTAEAVAVIAMIVSHINWEYIRTLPWWQLVMLAGIVAIFAMLASVPVKIVISLVREKRELYKRLYELPEEVIECLKEDCGL